MATTTKEKEKTEQPETVQAEPVRTVDEIKAEYKAALKAARKNEREQNKANMLAGVNESLGILQQDISALIDDFNAFEHQVNGKPYRVQVTKVKVTENGVEVSIKRQKSATS